MAKCGCNPICTCRINDGTCMDVVGLGSPTNPYKINVLIDNDTITCSGAGLTRTLDTLDTNTVDITGNGSVANPLKMDVILTPDANVPDPDSLGTGNLIKLGPTGIYVSCEDVQDCVGAAVAELLAGDCLFYDDTTNALNLQICPEPNGLECLPVGDPNCPAGGLAVIPSSDVGNGLTIGTDGRLFTKPFNVSAGSCLQPITQAGTPADPYVIAPQVAPEPNGLECIVGQGLAVDPSTDPNNGLTFGTDNRLFVDNCFNSLPSQIHIGEAGPCIETTGNGCTNPFTIIVRLSDDPCNGLCCRPDGLFVYQNPTNVPPFTGGFSENWQAGPFNGTFNDTVLLAPFCINVNNPSNCKSLLANILFSGTVELGKTSGNFVVQFETSLTGPGGPWNTAVSTALLDPDPPTPQAMQITNTVNGDINHAFELPPGGNQQVCVRIVADGFFLVNGRVFNSDRSFAVGYEWGQSLNTCP